VRAALQAWPVDRIFPLIDWLRVEALKQDLALDEVPFDRIVAAVQGEPHSKSIGAALTMALRFFCNVLVRSFKLSDEASASASASAVLIEIVGQSSRLMRGNVVWMGLLLSLLKK
jgi:hypothetical protein